jgi:hypothetical protein
MICLARSSSTSPARLWRVCWDRWRQSSARVLGGAMISRCLNCPRRAASLILAAMLRQKGLPRFRANRVPRLRFFAHPRWQRRDRVHRDLDYGLVDYRAIQHSDAANWQIGVALVHKRGRGGRLRLRPTRLPALQPEPSEPPSLPKGSLLGHRELAMIENKGFNSLPPADGGR